MTSAIERLTGPTTQTTAVEQSRAVAEVVAAVQVAQQCPRDVRRAWAEMEEACSRSGLAEEAFYKVPNRGQGPSVHLARELLRIWGNADAGVHELSRDDERGMSEVRAHAWDQQTNVRQTRTFQVPHVRMVKVKGEQTRQTLIDTTDIYLLNQNVGARAVRECIFAILPKDYANEAQRICRETLERGDGKPLLDRVADMVAWAKQELGLTVVQIETRLSKKRGQWSAADLADLKVVFSSIKRRETTADDEFPPERVTAAEITGAPPARSPMDRDLHLHDEQQSTRLLASMGQMHVPGKAESQPITEYCGFTTPDGACNLPADHATGPELDGYDGHDVVPVGEPQ